MQANLIEKASLAEHNNQGEYWKNKNYQWHTGGGLPGLFLLPHKPATAVWNTLPVTVSDSASAALLKVAGQSDLSLYILLVTLFKCLAAKYTGEPLVTTFSPPYQPQREYPETAFLAIQDNIPSSAEIRETAYEVRKTIIGAYTNQDFFIHELLPGFANEQAAAVMPKCHVLCTLENIHPATALKYEFPMSLSFRKAGNRVYGEVFFDGARIDKQLVETFCACFAWFLEKAGSDFRQKPGEIDWLPEPEKERQLAICRGKTVPAATGLLHTVFEQQAAATPNQTALIHNNKKLSYRELDELANKIANGLIAGGVHSGDRVPLLFSRSPEMIAAILAVLKTGAAFVPLNPEEPEDRLQYILQEIDPPVLLTNQEKLPVRVPVKILNAGALCQTHTATRPVVAAPSDNKIPAYLIFTSGTTGMPKGVIIEHAAIVNANAWRMQEYRLQKDDVTLLLFAYNFDGFILNLLTPLLSGSAVVLVNDEDARNPGEVIKYLPKYGVTHFTTVPAFYQAILTAGTQELLRTLKHVALAADVAEPQTIEQSRQLNAQLILSNEYGPTENAVISTFHRNMQTGSVKIIGRPIHNVNAYILDTAQQLLPPGAFGELCLGGAGLAAGYLNNEALTHAAFVEWNGERLYRTGDRARWLADGTIEFGGRMNDLVKIRGFRVGLEEIRENILACDAVKEVAVVVVGEHDDAGLYACVTAQNGQVNVTALQEQLRKKLPEYMLPQQLIELPALPVTDSGKYDIPAIRKIVLDQRLNGTDELPATETEQKLVEIWQHVLRQEHIGVQQNFFSLGGHSLKATALLSEIHSVFGVTLSLNQVFVTSTVRELAKVIDGLGRNKQEKIAPVPRQEWYALSSAQERLFALDHIETLGMAYNIPLVFAVKGSLSKQRLEQALNELIKRHEALRAGFIIHNSQQVQFIADSCHLSVEEINITGGGNDPLEAIAGELSPFTLSQAPLFRVKILNAGNGETFLLFDFHHIIIDETSLFIFFDELERLYHNEPLPPLTVQFKDYAAWQRSYRQTAEYKSKLAYWKEKFTAIKLEPLNLPYDFKRPARINYRGGRVERKISNRLYRGIQELCRAQQGTNFMFFLSVLNILLNRFTGQEQIIVGSPVSERARPETRNMIGLFLNTIPLLNIFDKEKDFWGFLQHIKNNVLADLGHSEVQFDDLVTELQLERNVNMHPLFNVMLAIIDTNSTALRLEPATAENLFYHNHTAKFDLLLEVHAFDDEITLYFEYASSLFSGETISRMADCFIVLLEDIIQNPSKKLAELQILDSATKNEILSLGRRDYNDEQFTDTIISLFEEQVRLRPDAVALVLQQEQMTYAALNQKANQLAFALKNIIAPEEIVAILCGHSFEAIISMLAVQKAGGTYLPLDIAFPRERIRNIIANSGTRLLLTDQANAGELEFSGKIINLRETDFSGNPDTNLSLVCRPESIAYVLYTSGTTGTPKGVKLMHRNTVNLVRKTSAYFPINPEDVWTMFHSYCFDVSVWEIYGSLLNGGKLVFVPRNVAQDPKLLSALVIENKISILCLPPSAFYLLSEEMVLQKNDPEALRYIILGGEAVKMFKLQAWKDCYPGIKLINGYGITETSVYSTYKEITRHEIVHNVGSIGKPIPANYIYILDEYLQVCPMGVLGEMYIGGICLSAGYLNNEELTNKRFIPDPFFEGRKMYRSGDLARWLPNGEINYHSRADHQVKVRGFRVETGEIESVLSKYKNITDVVVIGREEEEGSTQLVAYFTSPDKQDIAAVRTYLGLYLPHYMIPAYILQIEKIPLSTNGKVDRSKLPNPKIMHNIDTAKREATTPLQILLRDIWSDVLGVPPAQISIDDKFFFIGGDSISASLVVRRLNNYKIAADIADVFENNTIALFCETIDARQQKKEPEAATGIPQAVTDYWQKIMQEPVEDLPRTAVQQSGTAGKSVTLPVEVATRALLAVVDNVGNKTSLPEILLTAVGMAFRMWTGDERFGITKIDSEPETQLKEKNILARFMAVPLILEINDLSLCRENLAATAGKLQAAADCRADITDVMANATFANGIAGKPFFLYHRPANEATTDLPAGETQAFDLLPETVKQFAQNNLCFQCVFANGEINFTVIYGEQAFAPKTIRLLTENFKLSLRQLIDYYNSQAPVAQNIDQVVLEVESFNEVFYRECTYQAMIPVIRHFGANHLLFLANSYSIYAMEEDAKSVKFNNKYLAAETDENIFRAMGLQISKYSGSHDIVADVIDTIAKGAFAIVQIDCFYVERKKELYQKKHGPHSMLVFGYDKQKGIFHIIDNHATVSTNYQKGTIAFEEFKTAFAGFNTHFNGQRTNVAYYILSRLQGSIQTEAETGAAAFMARQNLLRMCAAMAENDNHALKIVQANVTGLVANEQSLITNIVQLNHVIGEVVNAKRIEVYKANYILNDGELTRLFEAMVEDYEYLRNVLTKMEITLAYSHKSVAGMLTAINNVVAMEEALLAHVNTHYRADGK